MRATRRAFIGQISAAAALGRPHPVYGPWNAPAPWTVESRFRPRGLGSLGVAQVLDPATTQTIAATIQRIEGYYPGSLAYRNNNPGNLVFVGQSGAVRGDGEFAKFPSYDAGLQALNDQIQIYAARGMSIQDMMNVYAPASDGNNPTAYAGQIASALGVDPNTNLLLVSLGVPDSAPVPPSPFDLPAVSGILDSVDPVTLLLAGLGLVAVAFIWDD